MARLQVVNDIGQLKVGQVVVVRGNAPSDHRGQQAIVQDFDTWGGDYGIYEAVWLKFMDGQYEHRGPDKLQAVL